MCWIFSRPARGPAGCAAQPASIAAAAHDTIRIANARRMSSSPGAGVGAGIDSMLGEASPSDGGFGEQHPGAQRSGALVTHGDAHCRTCGAAHDPFALHAIVGDVVIGPERDAR